MLKKKRNLYRRNLEALYFMPLVACSAEQTWVQARRFFQSYGCAGASTWMFFCVPQGRAHDLLRPHRQSFDHYSKTVSTRNTRSEKETLWKKRELQVLTDIWYARSSGAKQDIYVTNDFATAVYFRRIRDVGLCGQRLSFSDIDPSRFGRHIKHTSILT